jgi:hypothetical protein
MCLAVARHSVFARKGNPAGLVDAIDSDAQFGKFSLLFYSIEN